MSVKLIPILIDGKVLADEIERLRKTLPPEEFDNPASDIRYVDALIFEDPSSPNNQYAYAKLEPYKDSKYLFDAKEMRFQLLRGTHDSDSIAAETSADVLFRFIGEFIIFWSTNIPFNEHGLTGSAIIGPANASRLHLFFQQIDFESLRPFYEENCKKYDDGFEFTYLKSFEEFVKYAKALDGLLLQAVEKNKTPYMFAS